MNRNDFMKLMQSTAPAGRSDIGEVAELVGLFPYFQSAHLLLLKVLRDTEDVRFGSQLRISALQVADREVLYHHLNKMKETAHVASATADMLPDTGQTVIDSAKNSEQLISEIEKEDEPPREIAEEEDIERIVQEKAAVLEGEDSVEDMNLPDDTVSLPVSPFPDEPENNVTDNDLLELDSEVNGVAGADELPEMPSGTDPDIRKIQSELIDRFIIANPRIEPNRDKKDVPVEDKSAPSYEDGGFVTETLAHIYVSQGYYSRAIDIFEKLSLKFPEKSSYFATQIEKVKEHLKK